MGVRYPGRRAWAVFKERVREKFDAACELPEGFHQAVMSWKVRLPRTPASTMAWKGDTPYWSSQAACFAETVTGRCGSLIAASPVPAFS